MNTHNFYIIRLLICISQLLHGNWFQSNKQVTGHEDTKAHLFSLEQRE